MRNPGDVIVMGHRGISGLQEFFLGSVSNYVLHHAPCSVLIVQPNDWGVNSLFDTPRPKGTGILQSTTRLVEIENKSPQVKVQQTNKSSGKKRLYRGVEY